MGPQIAGTVTARAGARPRVTRRGKAPARWTGTVARADVPGLPLRHNPGMLERVVCPVLVRREAELAVLEDALLAAHRGESRFVLLAGEAGIGKTRLTTELVGSARKLGCAVLWGSCSEAELSLPYLPFAEAIGNYLATADVADLGERLGPARRELAQLFPQLSDGAPLEPGQDPAQAKLRLFEAFVSLLAAASRLQPLLLVVDDVHWADESTRELLDHLSRRLTALSVLRDSVELEGFEGAQTIFRIAAPSPAGLR